MAISVLIFVNLTNLILLCLLSIGGTACSPAIDYGEVFHDAGRTIRDVANDGYRTVTGDPLDAQLEAENQHRVKYPGLLPTSPPAKLDPVAPPAHR